MTILRKKIQFSVLTFTNNMTAAQQKSVKILHRSLDNFHCSFIQCQPLSIPFQELTHHLIKKKKPLRQVVTQHKPNKPIVNWKMNNIFKMIIFIFKDLMFHNFLLLEISSPIVPEVLMTYGSLEPRGPHTRTYG